MRYRGSFCLSILIGIFSLLVVATFTPSAVRGGERLQDDVDVSPPLFSDSNYVPDPVQAPDDLLTPPGEDIVARERFVNVNPSALKKNRLKLNLFNDFSVTAVNRTRQTSAGDLFWLGKAAEADISSVTISLEDGQIRGGFAVDGRYFTLIPVEGRTHLVREILQPDVPDEIDDVVLPEEKLVQAQSLQSQQAASGAGAPLIDVVVLWTPNARTALANSTKQYTNMEQWINYAFQIANEGYYQSSETNVQVQQRLRLVYAQEVPYTSDGVFNGFSTYLSDLNNGSDNGSGPLFMALNLEQIYRADLISLIVADASSGAGIGYLPNSQALFNTGPNESVTRWDAVFPNYTFSHELGHNMGLHHNRENASSSPYKPYGYGYRSPTQAFRTVMAYNCSPSCPRVNFFSNPDIMFGAEAMGVAVTESDSAHNAMALTDSANLVSNYRPALYDIAIGDTFLNSLSTPDVFGEWGDNNANEFCVNDQEGANDVVGVGDVTRFCVAGNQVDQLYFLQSSDEINLAPGGATTVCTLIDTEPNLYINFALCTTVVEGTGTPNSEVDTVALFSCDDTSTVTCGGATHVKDFSAARPSSGGHYTDGIYYFGNNETGAFGDDDSQLEIQVPFGDLGMSASSALICTKLSTFADDSSLDAAPLDQVLATNQYLQYDVDSGAAATTVDGCAGLALETAELVAPTGSISTTTPAFTWNAATSATTYTLVVYDVGANVIVFMDDYPATICSAGVCTAQPVQSLPNGNYTWLIRPEDNGVYWDWVLDSNP